MARIVFLRSKCPTGIEPRLAREARALSHAGHEVHAILWDRFGTLPPEERTRDDVRIHRYRIPAPEGQPGLVPQFPGWWLFIFRRAAALDPDVVHAIDFDTAWAGHLAAKIDNARFVYEIFDFYADMVTADMPDRLRSYLARAERKVVPRADLVILPDLRRTAQLQPAKPRRLLEILNVPREREIASDRAKQFNVFYGGMISWDRGLVELAGACLDAGVRLFVAGKGPDEEKILPMLKASEHVTYLGIVLHEEVLRRTAECHAIAALYDPKIPNNRFASPNKVFEAMMLSRPVIASEGTLAAEIVRDVGCGLVVPYGDREALAGAIRHLAKNKKEAREMAAKGRAAYEAEYNWPAMEERLLEAYETLLA